MHCPFCRQDNDDEALVCNSCSRDIAIPPSLMAERDDLLTKIDRVRAELSDAKRRLEALRPPRKRRVKTDEQDAHA
jgi:hypothetical protein